MRGLPQAIGNHPVSHLSLGVRRYLSEALPPRMFSAFAAPRAGQGEEDLGVAQVQVEVAVDVQGRLETALAGSGCEPLPLHE